MRVFIALLLLCFTSITYANQPVADVIQSINIQGISLSTAMTKASASLMQNGFEKVSESNKGTLMIFKKDDCRLSLTKRPESSLIAHIRYQCKKHEDADIRHALITLCETKNNGKNNRKGCPPAKPNKYGLVKEMFEHPETATDGYQYSTSINLLKERSSSIVISATAAKKNVNNNVSEKAKFPITVTGASGKNIKEANQVYAHCQKNNMRLTQDCGCYADAFLKKRIDDGFQANTNAIRRHLATTCLKVDKDAAQASCMRFSEIRDINMTPKKYCSCYAGKFADLIENVKGKKLSFNQKQSFKSQARGLCRDIDRQLK